MSVRIYDEVEKLDDQGLTTHYRCSKCDDLYQKRDNGTYRKAYLYVFNNHY